MVAGYTNEETYLIVKRLLNGLRVKGKAAFASSREGRHSLQHTPKRTRPVPNLNQEKKSLYFHVV